MYHGWRTFMSRKFVSYQIGCNNSKERIARY
nr:MAG TPA: hypothetical protein [Caudoviricetes sp.]